MSICSLDYIIWGFVDCKDSKLWIMQGAKAIFFIKMLVEWEFVCNFAVPELAKPLNDAQMCGSFYYVLACSENASPPNIHNPFR